MIASAPWYADFDACACRWIARPRFWNRWQRELKAGLAAAGVRIATIRSRVIFEEEFNDLIERHESKGARLPKETLALAAGLIESLPEASIA